MAEQDRRPDVGWMQLPCRLDQRAQAEWDDDLGHDRDVERRPGVAGALESPRVRECDRDEQPRHTEEAEELHPEPAPWMPTPWTPVGRPRRNSPRMMPQPGRQSISRCHTTGSLPESNRYTALPLMTRPATVVPTAAPAVPKRGRGPRPVMNATLHAMFSTVRRTPRRSGVRASPAPRRAPPTMKKSSIPMLPTNMMRKNGKASARTAGAAFNAPRQDRARTQPSGANSQAHSAKDARNA